MPDTVVAAIVAGIVAVVTSWLTARSTRQAQSSSQAHEKTMKEVEIQLAARLETHRAELLANLKQLDKDLDVRLEQQRSELRRNADLLAAYVPLQQKVKEHLSQTRNLLGRLFTSFSRLARLATSLKEDEILVETSNTLEIYSEYRHHLAKDATVSYPTELHVELKDIQEQLARIFLDLQVDPPARSDKAMARRMEEHLSRLEAAKERAIAIVERFIRVPLEETS